MSCCSAYTKRITPGVGVQYIDNNTGLFVTDQALIDRLICCTEIKLDKEAICLQLIGNLDPLLVSPGWRVTTYTVAEDGSCEIMKSTLLDSAMSDVTGTHEQVACPELVPIDVPVCDPGATLPFCDYQGVTNNRTGLIITNGFVDGATVDGVFHTPPSGQISWASGSDPNGTAFLGAIESWLLTLLPSATSVTVTDWNGGATVIGISVTVVQSQEVITSLSTSSLDGVVSFLPLNCTGTERLPENAKVAIFPTTTSFEPLIGETVADGDRFAVYREDGSFLEEKTVTVERTREGAITYGFTAPLSEAISKGFMAKKVASQEPTQEKTR